MASIDTYATKMAAMNPRGISRAIHRIAFSDCRNGLGIEIIGGYQEQSEEDWGIFVKKILPCGMAAIDSRLLVGDLILEVNGENLVGVTNKRALEILQMASVTNHMSLLIARDEEANAFLIHSLATEVTTQSGDNEGSVCQASQDVRDYLQAKSCFQRKEFLDLMEKDGLHSNTGSARNSPTELLAGQFADCLSSGSSSRSSCPLLSHSKGITDYLGKPALAASLQATTNDSMFQIITVSKGTGLGLNIVGGINRNEGPLVYVLEVIPGGDCHKDGRLRPGDQLVSVNGESLIGATYEEARNLLHRSNLRSDPSWEIAFVRQEAVQSHTENTQLASGHLPSGGCRLQHTQQMTSPALSPDENISAKMSVLSMKKTGLKAREKSPAISANNNTADVTAGATGPTWSDDYGLQRRKISLNPTIRLLADKLEMALNYLGIQPTKEQQEVLRQQLPKDSKGTVSFGDFVQVARNLFYLKLDGTEGAQGPTLFSTHEISRLLDSQCVSHDPLEMEEMEELRKARNAALEEIRKLKEELTESERIKERLTEELQTTKQEAKASVEETRALRSRIHLAEAAQMQARRMEMDYEEVIHLLEAEITELKAQLADHCGQNKDSIQDLRKRITVLDCQLRKSETSKKTFEVATEKLLQFVEVVHEALSDNFTSQSNLSDRKTMFSSKMLLARLGRSGRTITASLATEARELAKSIRSILEADCLPYGWEEAYTADGIKYFINHVTQTTSWIHPVTNVLTLPCSEENEDDGFRESPDPKS